MKIVVTADGPDVASQLDPRFGRARYLLAVDTESGQAEAHDNTQNLNAVQGAGIQAARNVAELGCEAVITGNVGPKAFDALAAGGVKVYLAAAGPVAQALEQFQAGRLECASRPNVQGHWT